MVIDWTEKQSLPQVRRHLLVQGIRQTRVAKAWYPRCRATLVGCHWFAEFERSLIRERVLAGLARARSQGKRLGRPPVPPITVDKIKRLREEGLSLRKIAKQVGISTSKVHQLV
jgi:hypothetical protein